MGNHYHLFIETPEANLVAGMSWLQNTVTRRYNVRHQAWGRLFGDRYKAVVVDGADTYHYRTRCPVGGGWWSAWTAAVSGHPVDETECPGAGTVLPLQCDQQSKIVNPSPLFSFLSISPQLAFPQSLISSSSILKPSIINPCPSSSHHTLLQVPVGCVICGSLGLPG